MGPFGKRYKTPDTSQWQMRNGLVDPGSEPAMQQQEGFWQGGDHFGGRDAIAGILAAVSDGLLRQYGGDGGAVQGLTGGRLSAIAMAKKKAEQDREMAAMRQRYIAAGADPANADLAVHGGEAGWLPKTESPHYFEDNAGNQWRTGPNGPERIFTDRVPKMYIQGDQAIQIDNPYLDQQGPPQAPVGKLTPLGGAAPSASPPFPPRRPGIPRRRY